MASSSDWIAQVGTAPQAAHGGAAVSLAAPGWIAALASREPAARGGFCDVSPFYPEAGQADADTASSAADAEVCDESSMPEDTAAQDRETAAFECGYARGQNDAQRENEAALRAERERFQELKSAFRALDTAAQDILAQDLQSTVLALCERVLGDYAADPDALVRRCTAAAERLGAGPKELTVHLNPETRARLAPEALADWKLADDPELAPGALRVSGPQGAARDGPQDWMRALSEALSA